ncbi:DUF3857 domain-containing transglutaminase family protein [Psychroflexus tropicus]|uniref:DUF3857 domain-containing transglutaminase family protein n=1 Tax=Psychroflexus tropicus TaxID=197345 RepID=UPI000366A19C|nr:DUF3857 and transglutaminase domain-containing protein [Psychroflexus tropicus]
MKKILFLLVVLTLTSVKAQNQYSLNNLPSSLTKRSNSVIRSHDIHLEINDYDDIYINEDKVITVLNKNGMSSVDLYAHYDKSTKIKNLKVTVYNAFGQEIKKFKERDFTDVSAVANFSLYQDDRVKYLEYTPVSYPITIRFEKELKSNNTAFIQSFNPYTNYYQSVQKSTFKINNNAGVELRSFENDFVDETVTKTLTSKSHHYEVNNLPAIPREAYSSSLSSFTPKIRFALSKFKLEGETGEFNSWKDFGYWQYQHLLSGQDELPESTIAKVHELTGGLTSTAQKARAIYNYVQDQMRYISVQIGLGGWKPISAEEVDEKKYGDCKGLTNYTKALLSAAGIESNYCVVNAGTEITDIEQEFPSMQGNHVILNIPNEEGSDIWLECTSQDIPFNFLGTFTDDRQVFAVTASGGEIMKTPSFTEEDNHQFTKAEIKINQKLIKASVEIITQGSQYDNRYHLEGKNPSEIEKHYQSYWDNLKELKLNSYAFDNDKPKISFTEKVDVQIDNYIKIYGNDLILDVNPFNKFQISLPKYDERKTPFSVERGFVDEDEFIFDLSQLSLNVDLEDVELNTRFGTYKLNFQVVKNKLIVKRYFKLKKK